MSDGIQRIYQRINEINSIGRNINSFKPQAVQDFENLYRESFSRANEINNQNNTTNNSVATAGSELQTESLLNSAGTEQANINLTNIIPDNIASAIRESSQKYGISEDLITAVIKKESNFDPNAISRVGAMGLMQLMPRTAQELGVTSPWDITQNIDGGTRYLKQMLERYDGDLDRALAAYNAGPTRVDQAGGIPDIDETRDYVSYIRNYLINR